ncbi:MAG: acyl--CoA ligase [Solirubrobacterales bacterium]|nr:acyl--CoA ligase [Solirubrobacterales bacterium]
MSPAGQVDERATITAVIDRLAELAPDSPAVQFPVCRMGYGELAESSLLAARRLAAAGVRAGDRVAILLGELDGDYLSSALGAARIGAVVVPVNARYKTRELTHLARDARPSILITSGRFLPVISEGALPNGCRLLVRDEAADFLEGTDRVSVDQVRALERRVGADDPVRIVYTSGTTANPRGCLHTHRALLAQGEAVAERLELTADDRFWTPLPMFHVAGWSTMLAAQARGACFNHVGLFDAGVAIDQISTQRCTVLFPGFETIWMAVLEHPRFATSDLSCARLLINVGVPQRMRVMQERLPGVPQVSNTGSTEACGFLAIGVPSDPLDARSSTAGRELAGMEVRIVDPETGEDVPDGDAGEMLFRGEWRLREYFGDPRGTADSIDAHGWFHSGDLLRRDEQGRLVYLSRIKDMLKVGGENVASAEIEDHLLTHPAVHMVHVVAAPDARYGEVPVAFVQLRAGVEVTEQELIDFCIDRIATFKVPRYVRRVQEWPMSGTKVKKVVLRERIAEELARSGIEEAPRLQSSAARTSR